MILFNLFTAWVIGIGAGAGVGAGVFAETNLKIPKKENNFNLATCGVAWKTYSTNWGLHPDIMISLHMTPEIYNYWDLSMIVGSEVKSDKNIRTMLSGKLLPADAPEGVRAQWNPVENKLAFMWTHLNAIYKPGPSVLGNGFFGLFSTWLSLDETGIFRKSFNADMNISFINPVDQKTVHDILRKDGAVMNISFYRKADRQKNFDVAENNLRVLPQVPNYSFLQQYALSSISYLHGYNPKLEVSIKGVKKGQVLKLGAIRDDIMNTLQQSYNMTPIANRIQIDGAYLNNTVKVGMVGSAKVLLDFMGYHGKKIISKQLIWIQVRPA